jgi:hypothetical protein
MKNRTNQVRTENNNDQSPGAQHRRGGPQLSDIAAISLSGVYERIADLRFSDAIAELHGVADLLAGNHTSEVNAIKQIVAAEAVLNKLRTRVYEM